MGAVREGRKAPEVQTARPPETAAVKPAASAAAIVAPRPVSLETKAALALPGQGRGAAAVRLGNFEGAAMPDGGTHGLAVVAGDGAAGIVRGYAALFHLVDLAGDRIVPGAFAASLAKRGAAGIRMLWQHEPGRPIGIWTSIAEDARGLRVEGRLALGTRGGHEAFQLIAAGAVDGLSIGFRTQRAAKETGAARRRLVEIDLWEISVVTFPMQEGARVLALGGGEMPLALRLRAGAERIAAGR
jgi:HK97 family phage prohead protease